MVAEMEVTDSVVEVLAVIDLAREVLAVMVLAHPGQVSAAAALVRDSAGRVDLRVEAFLVGQIAVASVTAAFAIAGLAILMEIFSILAPMALDI